MDALVGEAGSELRLQRVIDAVDDEVHDLIGRVDDAQAVASSGKGGLEELLVQLFDDLLLGGGIRNSGGTGPYRVVKRDEEDPDRYTVQNSVMMKIQNFPTSQLKLFIADDRRLSSETLEKEERVCPK